MENETEHKPIAFSPPDITEAEVDAVAEALRSGWITTGPRTKELERRMGAFTGTTGFACLNSATAALECALRLAGVGPGDEVIVPAYTYTASASVIAHVGAKIVLVDAAAPNEEEQPFDRLASRFHMDPLALEEALSPRTKAVIPVDIAGRMADYPALLDALRFASGWSASNEVQEAIGRPIVLADAAHSLGATRDGVRSGQAADFAAFSFHAVKNLTTAEGGGLAWSNPDLSDLPIYDRIMHLSLHGQTKDAMHKEAGSWEYDIVDLGYKWNMTDIAAAMGLAQLDRYPALLSRRRELVERYESNLEGSRVCTMAHASMACDSVPFESSRHLMLGRIAGATEAQRNAVIAFMADAGIVCNVHYKPLPMLSAYRALGFSPDDFPHACALYENEITLPLHTLLSDSDVDRVCETLLRAVGECA
ncbi:MAG: DegT/DnrJ/EryC1/StrS family aminotransferase [Eggerthellaceae bacterium]|nr:DegT/DnrJ/EryC1/StrS family aminotransferase [Eggerthellaceae bacterium]